MSILDSYKSLRDRKLNLGELVEFHIKSIIESVYRKITLKQKYKNPWSVEISGVIYSDIFIAFNGDTRTLFDISPEICTKARIF